ncbi:MAG: hypothetical protein Q9171_004562 [Xanthocarpia ochracea]
MAGWKSRGYVADSDEEDNSSNSSGSQEQGHHIKPLEEGSGHVFDDAETTKHRPHTLSQNSSGERIAEVVDGEEELPESGWNVLPSSQKTDELQGHKEVTPKLLLQVCIVKDTAVSQRSSENHLPKQDSPSSPLTLPSSSPTNFSTPGSSQSRVQSQDGAATSKGAEEESDDLPALQQLVHTLDSPNDDRTRRIRNLRHRKPIQLYPYGIENEKYRQDLQKRGLRPLRMAPGESQPTKDVGEDPEADEFGLDAESQDPVCVDSWSSSLPSLKSQPSLAATPQDAFQDINFDDEDLPEMDAILRRRPAQVVFNGQKRRKVMRSVPKLSQTTDFEGHRHEQRRINNTNDTVMTNLDESVFDIPTSPTLKPSASSCTDSRGFRVPRGLSPVVLPIPRPVTSSEPRRPPALIVDASRSDEPPSVSASSENESEASESEPDKDERLVGEQRKIRGVLPASWLKLDLVAQARNQKQKRKLSGSLSPEKDILVQRGVARPVAPRHGAAGASDNPMQSEDSSSEEDSEYESRNAALVRLPSRSTSEREKANLSDVEGLPLPSDLWDEVAEDNRIDTMVPTTARHRKSGLLFQRLNLKKKQVKLTEMRKTLRQSTVQRTPSTSSSRDDEQSCLVEATNRPRRLIIRPPELSLLDVPSPSSSSNGPIPSFIRVAQRTGRSRNDRGRSMPDRKYLRMATDIETQEANEYLRSWREGTLKPKPVTRRPNATTVACSRKPLRPCSGNKKTAPDVEWKDHLASKPGLSTNALSRSHVLKPPRSRSIQTSLDRMISLGTRSHEQPGIVVSRQVQQGSSVKQAHKEPVRAGHLVSSLRRSGHSRPATLESLQANIDRERPRFSLRHQLDLNTSHVAPNATANPLLAKFLEVDDVSSITTCQPGVAKAGNTPSETLGIGSRPRRSRKREPQRLNTQRHQLPATDLVDRLEIDSQQRRTTEQTTVERMASLIGLGPFGTTYTTSFGIDPLPTGSYFADDTFLGSGDFAKSLITSDLDQARDSSIFQFGPSTFQWGPWNDNVSAQLGTLIDQACEGLQIVPRHDEGALALVMSGIIQLLQQVVRYFSTSLSFYDNIDRTNFLQRCKALTSRLVQELPNSHSDLKQANRDGLGDASEFQKSAIRALNLCVVVASQLRQISKHNVVPHTIQANVKDFLRQSAVRVLRYAFAEQAAGFLQSHERLKHSSNNPVVFNERHVTVESLVVVSHSLSEDQSVDALWTGLRSAVVLPSLEAPNDARILEVCWERLFLVLPFLEIDRHGVLDVGRRHNVSCEDWTTVKHLLAPVLEVCRSCTHRSAPTLNQYCRVMLGRCFRLINTWGWRKCESNIGLLFDFFARRSLFNLPNEEAHGSPQFLAHLDHQPLLELAHEDRCFHVFLKIVGSGLRLMRKVYPDKKIGGIIWRLLPNHGRFLPKDQAISQVDLDALRNHHDLLCTLYWASPQGFRPKPVIIQNLVDVETSHREACRINIRAWSNLVSYQLTSKEPSTSLEPFIRWLTNVLAQILRQHQYARTEAEEQVRSAEATKGYVVNKSLLEFNIAQNQRQVEAILSDALSSMLTAMNIAPDLETAKMLLIPGTVSVFKLFSVRSSQTNKVIIHALEILLVFINKALPQDQVAAANGNDDSQDYGDWSVFSSVVLPATATTPAIAGYLEQHFLDPLRQLLSNCFGADSPPEDDLLTKVIDTWVAMGRIQVFEGLRSWVDYIGDYGHDSWVSLRNTEQTRKFLPYYLSVLVDNDRLIVKEHKQHVLKAWAASLVERESLLKYQHRLTSSLLNADSSDTILANPPFWAVARRFEITAKEFSERRLSLITNVLSNMRKSMEDAEGSEAINRRANHKEVLKVVMSSMKSNYMELGEGSNVRGAYVDFVHRVVQILQQHTSSICPIDRFFTDSSSFPLPADDPTYVVGQLRNYGLRLQDQRTPKQLAMFVQSVSERAAVDGQQLYLANQLSTAMDRNAGRDVFGSCDLRLFLIRVIFPAYVGIAFDTACGWIMAVPILQSTRTVFSTIMDDVDGANEAKVVSMFTMIIGFLGCLQRSLDQLVDQPGYMEQPRILRTVTAYFAGITAVLPALDYICRISRSHYQADPLISFFESFALFAAQTLLGYTDMDAPTRNHTIETEDTIGQHRDVQAFALQELRETLNRNWIYHDEQYYVDRSQTRREIVVDIGLFEEERAGVIREIEGFFNVLERVRAMLSHKSNLFLFLLVATVALIADAAVLLPRPRLGREPSFRLDRNTTLQAHSLPNPMRMPPVGRPYSIYFGPPGEPLDVAEFDLLFHNLHRQIAMHIQRGDDRVPSGYSDLSFSSQTYLLRVSVSPRPTEFPLMYSDVNAALGLFKFKLMREGYHEWTGLIVVTATEEYRGNVTVRRKVEDLENDVNGFQVSPPDLSPKPEIVPSTSDHIALNHDEDQKLEARSVMPNPYPLPGTPYSIDFDPLGPRPLRLDGAEVERAISYIRTAIISNIIQQGNQPIGHRTVEFGDDSTDYEFWIGSNPPPLAEGITVNDTIGALDAFQKKMQQEGYWQRYGHFIESTTGRVVGDGTLFRLEPPPGLGGQVHSQNKNLQLVPNPYLLPDSDLSIQFAEPGQDLLRNDVTEGNSLFRRKILTYIEQHGVGPMPRTLEYTWKSVELRLFSMPAYHRVTLNDTLDILAAYSMKMVREGYHSLWGNIILVEHGRQKLVAQVLLGPSGVEGLTTPETATAMAKRTPPLDWIPGALPVHCDAS